ncbi:hypothetical protein MmiAt1_07120 [Methanimicrococcus sp. At1]|uniref:Uncharacterized protein n=1 Tax=Methanimicrococcus hacksteinii TaxID=3028293 RepID=A0ABU3VP11_9EURY|nr:hypothetical protein [Methanimicrococcus sp. At1]
MRVQNHVACRRDFRTGTVILTAAVFIYVPFNKRKAGTSKAGVIDRSNGMTFFGKNFGSIISSDTAVCFVSDCIFYGSIARPLRVQNHVACRRDFRTGTVILTAAAFISVPFCECKSGAGKTGVIDRSNGMTFFGKNFNSIISTGTAVRFVSDCIFHGNVTRPLRVQDHVAGRRDFRTGTVILTAAVFIGIPFNKCKSGAGKAGVIGRNNGMTFFGKNFGNIISSDTAVRFVSNGIFHGNVTRPLRVQNHVAGRRDFRSGTVILTAAVFIGIPFSECKSVTRKTGVIDRSNGMTFFGKNFSNIISPDTAVRFVSNGIFHGNVTRPLRVQDHVACRRDFRSGTVILTAAVFIGIPFNKCKSGAGKTGLIGRSNSMTFFGKNFSSIISPDTAIRFVSNCIFHGSVARPLRVQNHVVGRRDFRSGTVILTAAVFVRVPFSECKTVPGNARIGG